MVICAKQNQKKKGFLFFNDQQGQTNQELMLANAKLQFFVKRVLRFI